jgi:hypothetical protein
VLCTFDPTKFIPFKSVKLCFILSFIPLLRCQAVLHSFFPLGSSYIPSSTLANMKLSTFITLGFAAFVVAVPTHEVEHKAKSTNSHKGAANTTSLAHNQHHHNKNTTSLTTGSNTNITSLATGTNNTSTTGNTGNSTTNSTTGKGMDSRRTQYEAAILTSNTGKKSKKGKGKKKGKGAKKGKQAKGAKKAATNNAAAPLASLVANLATPLGSALFN